MLAESPDSARDLIRRIVGWCADVHETNAHAVAHDGPCGERHFCPYHDDGYRHVEVLPNGDVLVHCRGERVRRGDLGYAERLAEFRR